MAKHREALRDHRKKQQRAEKKAEELPEAVVNSAMSAMQGILLYIGMVADVYAKLNEDIDEVADYELELKRYSLLKRLSMRAINARLQRFLRQRKAVQRKASTAASTSSKAQGKRFIVIFSRNFTPSKADERRRLAMHGPALKLQEKLRGLQMLISGILTQRTKLIGNTAPKVYRALLESAQQAESTQPLLPIAKPGNKSAASTAMVAPPKVDPELARLGTSEGAFEESRHLLNSQHVGVQPFTESEERELLIAVNAALSYMGLVTNELSQSDAENELSVEQITAVHLQLWKRMYEALPKIRVSLYETRVLCYLFMMSFYVSVRSRDILNDNLTPNETKKPTEVLKLSGLSEVEKLMIPRPLLFLYETARAELARAMKCLPEWIESYRFCQQYIQDVPFGIAGGSLVNVYAHALHLGQFRAAAQLYETHSEVIQPSAVVLHDLANTQPAVLDYLVIQAMIKKDYWVAKEDVDISRPPLSAKARATFPLQWYKLKVRKAMFLPPGENASDDKAWKTCDLQKDAVLKAVGALLSIPSLSGLPMSLSGLQRAGTFEFQSVVEPPGQMIAVAEAVEQNRPKPDTQILQERIAAKLTGLESVAGKDYARATLEGEWSVEQLQNDELVSSMEAQVKIYLDVPEELVPYFLCLLKAQKATASNPSASASPKAADKEDAQDQPRAANTEAQIHRYLERADLLTEQLAKSKAEEARLIQEIASLRSKADSVAPLVNPCASVLVNKSKAGTNDAK